ncbi:MAG: hypothetical protein AAGA67_13225 [Cyanobacteria bacterium P01_F01_bin.153]
MPGSNAFFVKLDGDTGQMVEKRQLLSFPDDYNPRDDGWEQVVLPSNRRFVDVLDYSRDGGFVFPAHLRDWAGLKRRLAQSPRFVEVVAALPVDPSLGALLNLLNSSMDSLIREESPLHLAMFQQMWAAFRQAVEASISNGTLSPGLIEDFEQIASDLDIQLEPPAP